MNLIIFRKFILNDKLYKAVLKMYILTNNALSKKRIRKCSRVFPDASLAALNSVDLVIYSFFVQINL